MHCKHYLVNKFKEDFQILPKNTYFIVINNNDYKIWEEYDSNICNEVFGLDYLNNNTIIWYKEKEDYIFLGFVVYSKNIDDETVLMIDSKPINKRYNSEIYPYEETQIGLQKYKSYAVEVNEEINKEKMIYVKQIIKNLQKVDPNISLIDIGPNYQGDDSLILQTTIKINEFEKLKSKLPLYIYKIEEHETYIKFYGSTYSFKDLVESLIDF